MNAHNPVMTTLNLHSFVKIKEILNSLAMTLKIIDGVMYITMYLKSLYHTYKKIFKILISHHRFK